jgi:hypothetical protein
MISSPSSLSTTYSAGLSGKASLIDETLTVLRLVAEGQSLADIRAAVLDSDVLGKATQANRRSVWARIHQRYLADWSKACRLAALVNSLDDRNAGNLLIYSEFCLSDQVLFDAITGPIYERYESGFTGVEIDDLQTWLDSVEPAHPEVRKWSPQTRKKVLSNVLTVLRDFGFMSGVARKSFQPIYLPLPVFGYMLYRLSETSPMAGPRGVVAADSWRLFFLDEDDVLRLLGEATSAGYCTYKRQGDVMTLELTWPNLEAYVAAIT